MFLRQILRPGGQTHTTVADIRRWYQWLSAAEIRVEPEHAPRLAACCELVTDTCERYGVLTPLVRLLGPIRIGVGCLEFEVDLAGVDDANKSIAYEIEMLADLYAVRDRYLCRK